MNYWWMTGFGVILIFFELLFGAITSLDTLFLGIAFMLAGLVFVFSNSLEYSLVIVAITYITYSMYLKQAVHKKLLLLLQRMGCDCIVGKLGVVIREVSIRKRGLVFFDGELWEAITADKSLPSTTKILVTSCQKDILTVVAFTSPGQEV